MLPLLHLLYTNAIHMHICKLCACLQVERPEQLREIVPQKRLADKVSGILSRIEAELDAVDEKIGERMHILDLDNDGLVRILISPCLACSSHLLLS